MEGAGFIPVASLSVGGGVVWPKSHRQEKGFCNVEMIICCFSFFFYTYTYTLSTYSCFDLYQTFFSENISA